MTDAELAVLSILAEGPIAGRDLQTEIARRGLRAWTDIGVASLYYLLHKLERQGLAQSDDAPERGASRRTYRLTPAGLGVLRTAVAELLGTPREAHSAFELGLANLPVLRPAQVRTLLAAYRQALAARLAQARERYKQLGPQPPFHIDALFRHRIALLEAELAWMQDLIAEWDAQAPPDERTPLPPAEEVEPMQRLMLPRDPDSLHRIETSHGRQPSPPKADPSPSDPPERASESDSDTGQDRLVD